MIVHHLQIYLQRNRIDKKKLLLTDKTHQMHKRKPLMRIKKLHQPETKVKIIKKDSKMPCLLKIVKVKLLTLPRSMILMQREQSSMPGCQNWKIKRSKFEIEHKEFLILRFCYQVTILMHYRKEDQESVSLRLCVEPSLTMLSLSVAPQFFKFLLL